MSLYDNIPDDLKNLDRWVCVKSGSKVPMQAKTRKSASSTDPATWSSFTDAAAAVNNGTYDNIGFVFNGDGLVGVDIDAGYDPDGLLSHLSVDCIRACQSYVEVSRSGRGIHILLRGELPFKGRNNGSGVEMYSTARYFIVTGRQMLYHNIVTNQQAIDYLVNKYFPETEKDSGFGTVGAVIYSPDWPEPTEHRIPLQPNYPPIKPGMRNISLTSLAGQLHVLGLGKDELLTELLRANSEACKPPLDREEVVSIVKSVRRYKVK